MYSALFIYVAAASALQLLPPPLDEQAVLEARDNGGSPMKPFQNWPRTVYISDALATTRDSRGLTLIPPSGREFAETFVDDLTDITGDRWTLEPLKASPCRRIPGIILDLHSHKSLSSLNLTYANGLPTEEGYTLDISEYGVLIKGTGARGAWWGTRTLLQHVLRASSASGLNVVDAPAYATRGYMLDAGRKWYAPEFLKELCTYASFFKMSEFHYHTSDNYPLNRGHNETWNEVYAQFSLRPEKDQELLDGLVQRKNETLSRTDFESLQTHCVRRGITIIPEIEAPGHCLSITKWKPELSLPSKKDLLNLTHPESMPTVKRIWQEFLPWFQTKEVHIGADEYDSTLVDDYIRFVNEMEQFVRNTSNKDVRIWGTHEPSENLTISTGVTVQHWQYGQSDPVELAQSQYEVVNSEDWWAYMSLKNDHTPILPAPYPQFFNETRVFNFGGREGWQWEPSLFNPVNVTEQLPPYSPQNKGAILAAWNDNGYDATTQLEAYYAVRHGIPLVASRAWSGERGPSIDAEQWSASADLFILAAPSQNLDRNIHDQPKLEGSTGQILAWSRSSGPASPNSGARVALGYGSKGPNYTMTMQVTGPFNLSSYDATLTLGEGGDLVFYSDGTGYPLRSVSLDDGFDPGHPGRIWSNLTTSTHELVWLPMGTGTIEVTITGDYIGGSRVWFGDKFAGRFEVFVFGGRNKLFSWSQMAFVAPLDVVEGGIEWIKVRDDVSPP